MKRIFTWLLVAAGLLAGEVRAQEKKPYYIGRHTVGLQYSYMLLGLQGQYRYVFNPMQRFMWMGNVGVGYSPFEPSPYYHLGGELAYGRKSRALVGLGYDYNVGSVGAHTITGDIGYLLLGRQIFFSVVIRTGYDYLCECNRMSKFYVADFLFTLGWAF